MTKLEPVHKDMTIMEIISRVPESVELILGAGLHCVGCGISQFETLAQGMRGHGFEDEETDDLVADINELQAMLAQEKSDVKPAKPKKSTVKKKA